MVPPASGKVSRVSPYSGSCSSLPFSGTGLSPALAGFPKTIPLTSTGPYGPYGRFCSPQPRRMNPAVWALSRSLAATKEIEISKGDFVSFSSSGYLDVSVPQVPFHTLWIGVWMTGFCPAGFPHSEICGSMGICPSPQLIAAYHVFHRLLVPRHPPCALLCLTCLGLFIPPLPSVAALQVCYILDVWPTIPLRYGRPFSM